MSERVSRKVWLWGAAACVVIVATVVGVRAIAVERGLSAAGDVFGRAPELVRHLDTISRLPVAPGSQVLLDGHQVGQLTAQRQLPQSLEGGFIEDFVVYQGRWTYSSAPEWLETLSAFLLHTEGDPPRVEVELRASRSEGEERIGQLWMNEEDIIPLYQSR